MNRLGDSAPTLFFYEEDGRPVIQSNKTYYE
jgi:hypothetical protein